MRAILWNIGKTFIMSALLAEERMLMVRGLLAECILISSSNYKFTALSLWSVESLRKIKELRPIRIAEVHAT
jgi:hypothetical protein